MINLSSTTAPADRSSTLWVRSGDRGNCVPLTTIRQPFDPPGVRDLLHQFSTANKTICLPETGTSPPPGSGAFDFILRDEVGRGGVGIVHAASQISLDRIVAIKRIRPTRDNPAARARLLTEARIQARLSHPAIPSVHLVTQEPGHGPRLIMQMIKGRCWNDLLDEDARQLAVGQSNRTVLKHLSIFTRICEAIAYANESGVIHRDVKPNNVLVGRHGEVYLLDWGIALELDAHGQAQPGSFSGTPAYAAPEMLLPEGRLCRRTDVYLLGATLFEILTGHPIHEGDSVEEVFRSISKGHDLVFPDSAPAYLVEICRRATQPDPIDRFDSVDDLLAAIRTYLEDYDLLEMLDRARRDVESLEQLVRDRAHPDQVEDAGHACRGLIEAVLVKGSQCPELAALRRRCLLVMVQHAIDRSNPGVARILLESMPDDPEVQELKSTVLQLATRLLCRPFQIATTVQLYLTEELIEARQEIAALRMRLDSADLGVRPNQRADSAAASCDSVVPVHACNNSATSRSKAAGGTPT